MYELARELGLTNKETLDLCESLGIGVKSHSSSVVDAQADRVRRKAEREGLVRDEQPPEPEKKAAKPKPKTKAAKAAKAAATPAADAPPTPEPEIAVAAEVPAAPAHPTPDGSAPDLVEPAAAAPTEPAPAPASAPAQPAAPPRRVFTSSGSEHPPPRPSTDEPEVRRPAAAATAPAPARPAAPPVGAPAGAPTAAPGPAPRGRSIPPPPGRRPPISSTGKPIPPPPGQLRRPSPENTGRIPGGPRRTPVGAGAGPSGSRPSGGPSRPMGGGPGGPGGPGGAPGGGRPGGRPGGGPGGPRRAPRRGRRRRRNRDELQPMSAPSYTPHNAPVPPGEIVVERSSTAQELGPKFNRTAADVVRFLMEQGEMVTATQSLSDDMIELFAAELGAEIRLVDPGEEQEVELQKLLDLDFLTDDEDSPPRAPVITVMGHVDHGKTKLLDYIRNANVVAGEAGGITQHIGAYQVDKNGKPITFIDTPGHEAFTAMRARGADATDIVVLVVAADDGVMPQTIEAIDHARAAEVPIVVAINKIDRENADPTRVMTQLAELGLQPEEWSGDTVMVQVSALTGLGIDDLLENLQVIAELEDLRANTDGRAVGVVLEVEPGHRSGPGGHRPGPAGHPAGRRSAGGRRGLGPGPGSHQRPGQPGQGSGAVHAGSGARACPRWLTPAIASWWPPTSAPRPRWRPPASTGSARPAWAATPTP